MSSIQLPIHLEAATDLTEEELAGLIAHLRQDLLNSHDEIERIDRPASAEAVPGKKGDPVTLTLTLLITLFAGGSALCKLIELIQAWITRHRGCTIEFEYRGVYCRLRNASPKEIEQYTKAIDRLKAEEILQPLANPETLLALDYQDRQLEIVNPDPQQIDEYLDRVQQLPASAEWSVHPHSTATYGQATDCSGDC